MQMYWRGIFLGHPLVHPTDLDTPIQFPLLVGEVPGVQNTVIRRNRYEGHGTVLFEADTGLW